MKSYSGKHDQGCHKCGGFPGSLTTPVTKLFQCLKCGFFSCNRHLKGGFSKICPNCDSSGKDLRSVMNKSSHQRVKSGGMPGHLSAKSIIKKGGASAEVSEEKGGFKGIFGGGGSSSKSSSTSGEVSGTSETSSREGKESDLTEAKNDNRVQEALLSSVKHEVDSLRQTMDDMHSLPTISTEEAAKLSDGKKEAKEDQEPETEEKEVGANEESLDDLITSTTSDDNIASPLTSDTQWDVQDDDHEESVDLEALEMMDKLLKDQDEGLSLTRTIIADSYFRIENNEGLSICEEYFKRSKDRINIVSIDASETKRMQQLQEMLSQSSRVFASVAYSPKSIQSGELPDMKLLEKMLNKNKIIAIGEVSLDLHFAPFTIDKQIKIFTAQVELSIKKDVPLFISSKKADAEVYKLLNKLRKKGIKPQGIIVPVVRSVDMFEMILDHGLYLLLRPEVTHDDEDLYRECIKELPIERLLLASGEEISSPKKRFGRWNSPEYIDETINYSASLLKIDRKDFLRQMAKNFNGLFNSDPEAGDDEFDFTPTAINPTLVMTEEKLLENDIDADGDELFIKEINDDYLLGKIYFDRDNRLFVYTPKKGFIGTDKFVYTVSDGRGGFDDATVTINVSKEYIEEEVV